MVGRTSYWFLVFLVGVVAQMALPGRAWAQAVTMSTTVPVVRVNGSSSAASSSSDNTVKLTITRADCKDTNLRFRFAMTVTGYQLGWNLEAWAGRSSSDCSGEFVALPGMKACWKLGNLKVDTGAATVEYSAAQLLGIGWDSTQSPAAKTILSSCDDMTDMTAGRQTFTVTFFLTYSSAVQGTPAKQPMYYSLTGPNAPAIQAVNAADSALEVSWESIVAGLTTEVSYEFYCAPNEGGTDANCKSSKLEAFGAKSAGDSAAAGAGAGGASGTGGVASSAGTAGSLSTVGNAGTSSVDTAGDAAGGPSTSVDTTGTAGAAGATSAPALSAQLCGVVQGKANTDGFTDPKVMPLLNDHSYAITMAVRDTYGNLGSLAPYKCKTPRQVDTFYQSYRNAGGTAGDGFCSLNIRPKHGVWTAAFGAMGLIAWLRRRQLRPRRRGQSDSSTL